jgi:hypothetical protein
MAKVERGRMKLGRIYVQEFDDQDIYFKPESFTNNGVKGLQYTVYYGRKTAGKNPKQITVSNIDMDLWVTVDRPEIDVLRKLKATDEGVNPLRKIIREELRLLKEWFPGKEEFRVIEDFYKQQRNIYSDAADAGIYSDSSVDNKIKNALKKLQKLHGSKQQKWSSGASVTIFVPVEEDEGYYSGMVLTVSKNNDQRLSKTGLNNSKKAASFWSIEISREMIKPTEAKRKYGYKHG